MRTEHVVHITGPWYLCYGLFSCPQQLNRSPYHHPVSHWVTYDILHTRGRPRLTLTLLWPWPWLTKILTFLTLWTTKHGHNIMFPAMSWKGCRFFSKHINIKICLAFHFCLPPKAWGWERWAELVAVKVVPNWTLHQARRTVGCINNHNECETTLQLNKAQWYYPPHPVPSKVDDFFKKLRTAFDPPPSPPVRSFSENSSILEGRGLPYIYRCNPSTCISLKKSAVVIFTAISTCKAIFF